MKRLQVLMNGEWVYVFCRNELKSAPIITTNKINAVRGDNDSLNYFSNHFANYQFRIEGNNAVYVSQLPHDEQWRITEKIRHQLTMEGLTFDEIIEALEKVLNSKVSDIEIDHCPEDSEWMRIHNIDQ